MEPWPFARLSWLVLGCLGRSTLLLRSLISSSRVLAPFSASGFSSVKWDGWGFCLLWRTSPLGITSARAVHFGATSKWVYVLEGDGSSGLGRGGELCHQRVKEKKP